MLHREGKSRNAMSKRDTETQALDPPQGSFISTQANNNLSNLLCKGPGVTGTMGWGLKVGLISGHRVIITSHRAQMTAPCSCQGPGGSHQVSPAAPGRALRASLAIWRHWQRLAHRIHTPAGTTAIPLRGTTLLLAVETSEVTVWHIEPICSASEDLSLELLQY